MKALRPLGSLRPLLLALAALNSVACMKQYVPPTPGEPHAIVKFRRSYESTPGVMLSELLVINGQRGYQESLASSQGDVPRTDALLVHPGSTQLKLVSTFTHQQSYTTTQSYSCGTSQAPQQCTRTVTQQRTVTDGACSQEMAVRLDSGQNYLLQLSYQDHRNCSASCLIQEPLGNGKFKNRPCVHVALED